MARKKKSETAAAAAAGTTVVAKEVSVVVCSPPQQQQNADSKSTSTKGTVGGGSAGGTLTPSTVAESQRGSCRSSSSPTSGTEEQSSSAAEGKQAVATTIAEKEEKSDVAAVDEQLQQGEEKPQEEVGVSTRLESAHLSASQRKNLKKKLRKQEQRQQEAAVLAAVRGEDCSSSLLIGDGEEAKQGVAGGIGRADVAVGGRGVSSSYAEIEQALKRRFERLRNHHSSVGCGGAAAAGKDNTRRLNAEVAAFTEEIEATLRKEEALLRKPVRKRVGVQQLQDQIRDVEAQVQKQQKVLQRKRAAAQQQRQQQQQRCCNSNNSARGADIMGEDELQQERSQLEESLRYMTHLREQLVLTQQQQDFRNFQNVLLSLKSECEAFGKEMIRGAGAAATAAANGRLMTAGGLAGTGLLENTPSAGLAAGGSMNGAVAAPFYSPAKEAQWRKRLADLTRERMGVSAASANASQPAAAISPSPQATGAASAAGATGALTMQAMNLSADAMSLLFPGGGSKLPLIRKLERAFQVVVEKQSGGGGRGGSVLVIGMMSAAVKRCSAALSSLEEGLHAENKAKNRVEVQGCTVGSIIGTGGAKLRKVEEECDVVVWAEGTEMFIMGPSSAAVAKGVQQLKEVMAAPQQGATGGGNNNTSISVSVQPAIARALSTAALRHIVKDIESSCNCSIRILRGGAEGVLLVTSTTNAAAAVKALKEAAAQLHVETVVADSDKVQRLLKSNGCSDFDQAIRERGDVACLRFEEGMLLVGPAAAVQAAKEAAAVAVQQLSRVVASMNLTPEQLRVVTRARRAQIEEETGVIFRPPRAVHTPAGGGGSGKGAGNGGLRVVAGKTRGGGFGASILEEDEASGGEARELFEGKGTAAGGVAGNGDKDGGRAAVGLVTLSFSGREEEVTRAREQLEQLLKEKGYCENMTGSRDLIVALLAERGSLVREMEVQHGVTVSIERPQKRLIVRGPEDAVQRCIAVLKRKQEQLQQEAAASGVSDYPQQRSCAGGGGGGQDAAAGASSQQPQQYVCDGEDSADLLGGSLPDAAAVAVTTSPLAFPPTVVERVPIRRDQVSGLIGKHGVRVRRLQAASGVDYIRVDDMEGVVLIKGTPQAAARGVQLVTEALQQHINNNNSSGIDGSNVLRPHQRQQQLNGDAVFERRSAGSSSNSRSKNNNEMAFAEQQEHETEGGGTAGTGNELAGVETAASPPGGKGSQFGRRPRGVAAAAARGRMQHSTRNGGRRSAPQATTTKNRYSSAAEQQQQHPHPVSMDASDEIAFPSLENAAGAAALENARYHHAAATAGAGWWRGGGSKTYNSKQQQATRTEEAAEQRDSNSEAAEAAAAVDDEELGVVGSSAAGKEQRNFESIPANFSANKAEKDNIMLLPEKERLHREEEVGDRVVKRGVEEKETQASRLSVEEGSSISIPAGAVQVNGSCCEKKTLLLKVREEGVLPAATEAVQHFHAHSPVAAEDEAALCSS